MKNLACLTFLILAIGAAGQTAKPPTPPAPPAAVDKTPAPAILDADKLKTLQIAHQLDDVSGQLKNVQLQSSSLYEQFLQSDQVVQLEAKSKRLQTEIDGLQAQLEAAKAEALKAAKVDGTKFDLDLTTWQPIPKPPSPPR